METEASFQTLGEYQAWASTAWVYRFGSLEAQQHARGKLAEESRELIQEIDAPILNKPAMTAELGDWLWCGMAAGSNAGFDAERSLRQTYPEHFGWSDGIDLDQLRIGNGDVIYRSDYSRARWIGQTTHELGRYTKQWFELGNPQGDVEAERGLVMVKGRDAQRSLANLVLIASEVAESKLDMHLSDVMRVNREKIQQRIADGRPVTSLVAAG